MGQVRHGSALTTHASTPVVVVVQNTPRTAHVDVLLAKKRGSATVSTKARTNAPKDRAPNHVSAWDKDHRLTPIASLGGM